MDVRVGLWKKLSTEELMLLNCGVGEDSWESLELQGDPTVHLKGDQSWVFIGGTDAEVETPVFWSPDANSSLIGKVPNVGNNWGQRRRGHQGMRWLDGITDAMTWTWAIFERWWGTGRSGMLQSMGSQKFIHDWATEQQHELIMAWLDKHWWMSLRSILWNKNLICFYLLKLTAVIQINLFLKSELMSIIRTLL